MQEFRLFVCAEFRDRYIKGSYDLGSFLLRPETIANIVLNRRMPQTRINPDTPISLTPLNRKHMEHPPKS